MCRIDATSFSTANTSSTFSAVKRNGSLCCSSAGVRVQSENEELVIPLRQVLGQLELDRQHRLVAAERLVRDERLDRLARPVLALGQVDRQDLRVARASGVTLIVPVTFFSGTRSNGFSAAAIIGIADLGEQRHAALTLTDVLFDAARVWPFANSSVQVVIQRVILRQIVLRRQADVAIATPRSAA